MDSVVPFGVPHCRGRSSESRRQRIVFLTLAVLMFPVGAVFCLLAFFEWVEFALGGGSSVLLAAVGESIAVALAVAMGVRSLEYAKMQAVNGRPGNRVSSCDVHGKMKGPVLKEALDKGNVPVQCGREFASREWNLFYNLAMHFFICSLLLLVAPVMLWQQGTHSSGVALAVVLAFLASAYLLSAGAAALARAKTYKRLAKYEKMS